MSLSTFERRKEAPLHYQARADNARLCAFLLYHQKGDSTHYRDSIGYGGTPEIGFYEGYLREAGVALELIVKAVITVSNRKFKLEGKTTTGMPKHHRLPELWSNAKLPNLLDPDKLRLRAFQEVLEWSGRYPTPKKEEIWDRDIQETMPPAMGTSILIRNSVSLGWEDFDRLYQISSDRFGTHIKSSYR